MEYTGQNQQCSNLHSKGIVMKTLPKSYFAARGLRETSFESLNEALMLFLEQMEPTVYDDPTRELTTEEQAVLRQDEPQPGPDPMARTTVKYAANLALMLVLEQMEPMVYGDATRELTAEEQDILRQGGLVLEPQPGPDPMAQTTVKYAAIVTRSLSSKAASRRLGLSLGRIRRMIADRSLYSFRIGHRRCIPDFQFQGNRLVSNIAGVNKALPHDLHPVEVYNWYHLPNLDLFLGDNIDDTIRPLDWLKGGYDAERVVFLANRMEGPRGQASEQTRSGPTSENSSELGLAVHRDPAPPHLPARR